MSDLRMQIAFENLLRKKAAAGPATSSATDVDAARLEPRTAPVRGAQPEPPRERLRRVRSTGSSRKRAR